MHSCIGAWLEPDISVSVEAAKAGSECSPIADSHWFSHPKPTTVLPTHFQVEASQIFLLWLQTVYHGNTWSNVIMSNYKPQVVTKRWKERETLC